MTSRPLVLTFSAAALSVALPFAAPAQTAAAPAAAQPAATEAAAVEKGAPTAEMQMVLDKLKAIGGKPIGTVTPDEQRKSPTPADAVKALMKEKGIQPDPKLAAVKTKDAAYPTAGGGDQKVRIYTPEGAGPLPMIVYYHGGGWVIGSIDVYDASARALAAGTGAVVASVEYRLAPEARFPAQHEDADAAYAWLIENSGQFNADATRVAVAGESAGGNLAVNVAIDARDKKLTTPKAVLAVYPVAGHDLNTPSYQVYADAQPLSKPAMEWFVKHVFKDMAEAANPRIDLKTRNDLAGLPPVLIVSAEIDPFQTEGKQLEDNMKAQGVEVTRKLYKGATHEFFGMGAIVPQAKDAMTTATEWLKKALM